MYFYIKEWIPAFAGMTTIGTVTTTASFAGMTEGKVSLQRATYPHGYPVKVGIAALFAIT